MNEPDFVIYSYPWQQAVEDNILRHVDEYIEGSRPPWTQMPLLMTTNLFGSIRGMAIAKIGEKGADKVVSKLINSLWNEYVGWREYVIDTLPEEEQMFETERYGLRMWIIDDGTVTTFLLPSDY